MKSSQRIYASLLLGGLLSASPLTIFGDNGPHSVWTPATATAAAKSGKVTSHQLMEQMRKSLEIIIDETSKMKPEVARKHMVPFLDAFVKTADNFQALEKASKAHATKDYAKAVLGTAESIGRLDATYRLAHVENKTISAAMQLLGDDWRVYLHRFGGGKGGTADTRKHNERRIAALHKHLDHLAKNRAAHPAEKKHIAEMIAKLNAAAKLNHSKGDQWLALALMSDVTGWYGGYYDYYLVYDPNIATYYKNGYHYFQEVYTEYNVEFSSYYTEYSWASYEVSIDSSELVSTSHDVSLVATEETVIAAEVNISDASVEHVDEVATADLHVSVETTEQAAKIDHAEEVAHEPPAANFVDPAEVANPEADSHASDVVSNEEADSVYDEAEEADTAEAHDEAAADEPDDPEPEPAGDADED